MDRIESLLRDAVKAKKAAQAVAKFLKTGKCRSRIESLYALAKDNISVYSSVGGATVYVGISISDLEGFKSERLAGVLDMLNYWNPGSVDSQDYPGVMNRDFTFRFTEAFDEDNMCSPEMVVSVHAYIKENSETCKRVVKGYREAIGPQPIYEFVCDETNNPEAQNA